MAEPLGPAGLKFRLNMIKYNTHQSANLQTQSAKPKRLVGKRRHATVTPPNHFQWYITQCRLGPPFVVDDVTSTPSGGRLPPHL